MLAICPQQVVLVVLVEFGERHDTRTNGHAAARGKLNREVARHARHSRTASSRGCRAYRACRRVCHEDATRMLR